MLAGAPARHRNTAAFTTLTGHFKVRHALLVASAGVHEKGNAPSGRALPHASNSKQGTVCALLLDAGADVNAVYSGGGTALQNLAMTEEARHVDRQCNLSLGYLPHAVTGSAGSHHHQLDAFSHPIAGSTSRTTWHHSGALFVSTGAQTIPPGGTRHSSQGSVAQLAPSVCMCGLHCRPCVGVQAVQHGLEISDEFLRHV